MSKSQEHDVYDKAVIALLIVLFFSIYALGTIAFGMVC